MAMTIDFYEARAEEAGEEAQNAFLENVCERALRSEAAWRAMANKATDVANARAVKLREAAEALQQVEAEASSLDEHGLLL